MHYFEHNDYEILEYVAEGSQEATDLLFKKYEPKIKSLAKQMFHKSQNLGIDYHDLVQEGMLGLSLAMDTYKTRKEASFYTYASTCIKNKMISAIIATKRLKRKLLNESISFEFMLEEENTFSLGETLVDDKANPETVLMDLEVEKEFLSQVKTCLTELENQVFELKIVGFDYKEIAEILDKPSKSIDNALQRIKIKIKGQLGKVQI